MPRIRPAEHIRRPKKARFHWLRGPLESDRKPAAEHRPQQLAEKSRFGWLKRLLESAREPSADAKASAVRLATSITS